MEIVLGPPGTGKTTALLAIVEEELARGTPPDRIGYLAFTKRAATVAVERAAEKFSLDKRSLRWFRTIHSLCFQALGLSSGEVLEGKKVVEFGSWLGVRLSAHLHTDEGSTFGNLPGDRAMHMENLARVVGVPLRDLYARDSDDLPWVLVDKVSRGLEQYKRDRHLLDYTDMLERFCLGTAWVPSLDVLIVDEAQDLSLLQWRVVYRLAERARRVVVAGDDDQCHPAGTMILTPSGEKPVEKIRSGDLVVQYDRNSQSAVMRGDPVSVSKRRFSGRLYNINGLEVTPDHRMLISWDRRDSWITYVQRRGEDYRVGWCHLFRSNKARGEGIGPSFNLNHRRVCCGADAMWVVALHDSKQAASFHEQELSIRYEIPTVPFKALSSGPTLYTQDALDKFFSKVRGRARVAECLSDYGRDIRYPIVQEGEGWGEKRSKFWLVRACNVVQGAARVPRLIGRRVEWEDSRVSVRHYDGHVYSLDAPKYRYYVANRIVVHNCIYRWAGAAVEHFVALPGEERVLGLSYRCPVAVQELAVGLLERLPPTARREKRWSPRPEAGEVIHVRNPDSADWSGGETLVLVRNAFLATDWLCPMLRQDGIVYEWRGQPSVRRSTTDAILVWERLRRGEAATADEIRRAYALMTAGRGVRRGHKTLPGVDSETQLGLGDLRERHGLQTDAIWHEALDLIPEEERLYMTRSLRRGEKLLGRPRVRVSTIHGAKGGEADHVVLLTDLAARTHTEGVRRPWDEARVWYVACTRARQRLTVVQARSGRYFDLARGAVSR